MQVLNHPTLRLFSVQAAHLSETVKPPQTRQTHSEAVPIETLPNRDCRAGSGQVLVQERESSGVSSSSCGLPPHPRQTSGPPGGSGPGRERLWRSGPRQAPASALCPLLFSPWGSQSLCGWVAGPYSASSRRPSLTGDPPAELVTEMPYSPPTLDASDDLLEHEHQMPGLPDTDKQEGLGGSA